ncbi:MAG TPA: hypothetical protein VKV28_05000 [Candidatus Binataceae bacterium]|nr:hypothetical protein [Candidatus Binataceae bacterium]
MASLVRRFLAQAAVILLALLIIVPALPITISRSDEPDLLAPLFFDHIKLTLPVYGALPKLGPSSAMAADLAGRHLAPPARVSHASDLPAKRHTPFSSAKLFVWCLAGIAQPRAPPLLSPLFAK